VCSSAVIFFGPGLSVLSGTQKLRKVCLCLSGGEGSAASSERSGKEERDAGKVDSCCDQKGKKKTTSVRGGEEGGPGKKRIAELRKPKQEINQVKSGKRESRGVQPGKKIV